MSFCGAPGAACLADDGTKSGQSALCTTGECAAHGGMRHTLSADETLPSPCLPFKGYCRSGICGDRGTALGLPCDPNKSNCDNGAACSFSSSTNGGSGGYICGGLGSACVNDHGCAPGFSCGSISPTTPCDPSSDICVCGGFGAKCTVDAGQADALGRGPTTQCAVSGGEQEGEIDG